MSGRLNRPKQTTLRKSKVFDDTIPPGQTNLETDSTGLEFDQNAQRSQLSRFLDATGVTRWYSDILAVNGKKRALLQLNEDLDAVERITEKTDPFVPTTGQTIFTLSEIPIDPNQPKVNLNGQKLNVGQNVFFSGTVMTISLPYQLGEKFKIFVQYNFLS